MLSSIIAFQYVQRRQTGSLRIEPNNHYTSNIKNKNRLITIFNEHTEEVLSLDVKDSYKDSYIASCSHNEIIVQQNGKTLWTYPIEPEVIAKAKVKIIDGYLVFFSSMRNAHKLHYDNRLLFLNLKDGTKVFELNKKEGLGTGKVAFCGNRVFTLFCGDNKIREWNPIEKCLKAIPTNSSSGILSVNDKYLIHAYQDRISINYFKKNRRRHIIHLPKYCPTWQKVKCLFLDDNRLFCGLTSKSKNTLYDFHVINLERECISRSFLTPKTEVTPLIPKKYYIKSMTAFKDHVFIGNSEGQVVAFNLNEKKATPLILKNQHQTPVNQLIIYNNMLISTSDCSLLNNIKAEIKFWNLDSLEQIKRVKLDSLTDCHFDNWNLVTGTEQSILKWDFKNFHRGKQFTENSAREIKILDIEDISDSGF